MSPTTLPYQSRKHRGHNTFHLYAECIFFRRNNNTKTTHVDKMLQAIILIGSFANESVWYKEDMSCIMFYIIQQVLAYCGKWDQENFKTALCEYTIVQYKYESHSD